VFSQTDTEIGNVYIGRALKLAEQIEFKKADEQFEKAMKYLDSVKTSDVAWLGVYIKYELKDYKKAKQYAKKYFLLKKNKKGEEYKEMLDTYVDIEEKLLEQEEEERRLELERLRKEREQRRLDSLETVWNEKSASLSLKVDEVQAFNKFGTALFKKDNFYGILNDKGIILVEADKYKGVRSFAGYTLFLDRSENPSKVMAFDHSTLKAHMLPSPNVVNTLSTNFSEVMLPRANGKVVLYPNNSLEIMSYDLVGKKIEKVADEKELFKELKKTDKIQKSNKEGQIKINKDWFHFGGDLGAGVYPLFGDDYSLKGFLSSITGNIIPTSSHNHIGSFYDGTYQYFSEGKVLWMNQSGESASAPKDAFGEYSGETSIQKTKAGSYQFLKGGIIILGDQELKPLKEFLENPEG
jgi:hypothetical protein